MNEYLGISKDETLLLNRYHLQYLITLSFKGFKNILPILRAENTEKAKKEKLLIRKFQLVLYIYIYILTYSLSLDGG